MSRTIAQLVTCINTERWQVTHHQSPSPRCADMLRREKHLYQFMLVWNCIHFFAQKLLFSVSFLLGCPFCWCLSICNNISLNMLKKYDLEGVFVASHLTRETITIIAKDNIDPNAISTKVKKHFHGICMTTMQFPLKENQGVKQNVIYDLSLLDNSYKLALPENYEIISEPPYRKKTPRSLPVYTINKEYLNFQDTLFKTEFDKEIAWVKPFYSKYLPRSSTFWLCSWWTFIDAVDQRKS